MFWTTTRVKSHIIEILPNLGCCNVMGYRLDGDGFRREVWPVIIYELPI